MHSRSASLTILKNREYLPLQDLLLRGLVLLRVQLKNQGKLFIGFLAEIFHEGKNSVRFSVLNIIYNNFLHHIAYIIS